MSKNPQIVFNTQAMQPMPASVMQTPGSPIRPIVEESSIGAALKELNSDELDPKTRMSSIDMKARLSYLEISGLLQIDMLVTMGFLPVDVGHFTRQKKRLSVSLKGLGRQEIIDIVRGDIEKDKPKSFMGFNFGDKQGGMK